MATQDSFWTHKIVSMERRETSGSGQSGKKYPMWTCKLANGEKVNVFKHERADRNSHRLFDQYPEIDALEVNEVMTWSQHPIEIRCIPDGQWLKVAAVAPRPDAATPDEEQDMTQAATLSRTGQFIWARQFLACEDAVLFDLETNSKANTAEILSIAIVDAKGETLLKSLVKPVAPNFVNDAEHINGITAEMLKDAPTLSELYPQIALHLGGKVVGIYNSDYDLSVLNNALIRAGHVPVAMLATCCVMRAFAAYRGEWDFAKSDWKWAKLSEAAAAFGIPTPEAHDALPDTLTTLEVVRQMAALNSPDKSKDIPF